MSLQRAFPDAGCRKLINSQEEAVKSRNNSSLSESVIYKWENSHRKITISNHNTLHMDKQRVCSAEFGPQDTSLGKSEKKKKKKKI